MVGMSVEAWPRAPGAPCGQSGIAAAGFEGEAACADAAARVNAIAEIFDVMFFLCLGVITEDFCREHLDETSCISIYEFDGRAWGRSSQPGERQVNCWLYEDYFR